MTRKKQNNPIDILNFDLQYDYVLVEAIETVASSGLVNPSQYDDKPEFGKVIKCGTGRLLEDGEIVPLSMKPGDIIFFGKYSSISVRSNGKDYFIIRDDDVMAVNHDGIRKKA